MSYWGWVALREDFKTVAANMEILELLQRADDDQNNKDDAQEE